MAVRAWGMGRRPVVLGAAGLGVALAVLLGVMQVAGGDGTPPRLLTTGTPVFDDPRGDPPAPADHVSAAAAGQWADFPAGRGRRPIVLVGPDQAHTSWRTDGESAVYQAFRWNVPDRLPAAPARAGGYELISAAEALSGLRGGKPVNHGPGYRLTVTDVRLGSRLFRTDRGQVRLPAWFVTFRGGTYGPSSILAIAPSARRTYRSFAGPHVIDRVRVAADGRTLTVHFVGARAGTGPCTADYVGGFEESAGAVGVVVLVKPRPARRGAGGPVACTAEGYPRKVTLRLTAPLGHRVAFDGQTADPLLAVGPGVPRRAGRAWAPSRRSVGRLHIARLDGVRSPGDVETGTLQASRARKPADGPIR